MKGIADSRSCAFQIAQMALRPLASIRLIARPYHTPMQHGLLVVSSLFQALSGHNLISPFMWIQGVAPGC